jgi:hypothetical protein
MITHTPEHNVITYSEAGPRIQISPLNLVRGEAVCGVTQINTEPIPESFFRGLADCEAGRVVEMDRAMNESPPGNA